MIAYMPQPEPTCDSCGRGPCNDGTGCNGAARRRVAAIPIVSGVGMAAAAAAVLSKNPWGSVFLDRDHVFDDFGFAPFADYCGSLRRSSGKKKWSAARAKRSAKRKAQKRARATSRKHRKH